MSEEQTNFIRETENFEAFELVTEALEKIDSYDPKKYNIEVLREAESQLTKAVDVDPHYLKAQYLRGIVRFLENKPREALSQFENISSVSSASAFWKEVRYNIAASHSALENWETAITEFKEVLESTENFWKKDSNNDPEVRLLTHAGLAFSYAGRIREVQKRIEDLKKQDSKEAIDSRKRNEERVKEYSKELGKQYELARSEAQRVSDREIVWESEQIFRDAYDAVDGPREQRIIKLVAAKSRKERWLFNKWIIIGLIVFFFFVFGFFIFVQIYPGWDRVLPFRFAG